LCQHALKQQLQKGIITRHFRWIAKHLFQELLRKAIHGEKDEKGEDLMQQAPHYMKPIKQRSII